MESASTRFYPLVRKHIRNASCEHHHHTQLWRPCDAFSPTLIACIRHCAGPFLVPKADIADPANLRIRTWVNETLMQDGNTSQMIFSIPQLIAFISQGTTLFPGTVICTGTPAGVGYVKNSYLKAGDVVRVTIDGLGTLRNPVAEETKWGAIAFS